ncbi:hypothetical protein [Winogradskyella flava]|uniref:Thrombospondin type 3 repeat-containing protein n=1 Tax=Winogradskyella flava TaxID=1884876 RepID=A0A842IYR3_9FLAO|nr:hypothetical protein [Winogradskyella flava]MBC2846803.1 hypothetical protein [Winogradskyella flava]
MQRYNFTNPLFLFKIETMMRRFFICFSLLSLFTCDDGDIITVELEFDQDLERCEDFEDSYVIFDTREDPNEALILIFPRDETTDEYFTNDTPAEEIDGNSIINSLTIDESAIRFIYRTYNRALTADDICSILPPSNLNIIEDYEADAGGTVQVTFSFVDDDNDDVPSIYEYGPGGIDDPQDSDDDGIPDYLDQDDDNDNVLTKDELNDDDDDDDPMTNPLNTDANLPNGDDIPDYLDNDDDGDGFPTRLEDETESQNPRDLENFVIDTGGIEVYRYLSNDANAMESFPDSGFIFNTYTRSATTRFEILNAGLEIINSTYIDMGTFEDSFDIDNEPDED